MLEGLKNYSVGRGTDTPFEFFGADWIDGKRVADHLNGKQMEGVRFYAVRRTPQSSKFAGIPISGVQITITDRAAIRTTSVGLEIAKALLELHPGRVKLGETEKLIGNRSTIEAVERSSPSKAIYEAWRLEIEPYLRVRQQYLLY